jgi:hypothetical protein
MTDGVLTTSAGEVRYSSRTKAEPRLHLCGWGRGTHRLVRTGPGRMVAIV